MGDPAVAALLGAREDPVADAERATPAPALHARAAAAPAPSASQRSGTAQAVPLSSTSTTRSTVTLGTPPILWKARPGALSISPSSRHVAEQRLERDLVLPRQAEGPRDLALAGRLVASLDEVEDLLAGGKAGAVCLGIGLLTPSLRT